MGLKTKKRINTKIRLNASLKKGKGKKSNSSFLTKVQGTRSVKSEESYGFCLLHNVNVGKEKFYIKKCITCEHFVNYKNKKGDD